MRQGNCLPDPAPAGPGPRITELAASGKNRGDGVGTAWTAFALPEPRGEDGLGAHGRGASVPPSSEPSRPDRLSSPCGTGSRGSPSSSPSPPASCSRPSGPDTSEGERRFFPTAGASRPPGRHVMVGDLPLGHGRVSGRAMGDRHQQRLREADADGGGSRHAVGRGRDADPRRLARPRLASRREASLRVGGRRRQRPGAPAGARASSCPARPSTSARRSKESFVGGVAVRPDGRRLFAVHVLGQRLSALDLASGEVAKRRGSRRPSPTPAFVSADGATLYVSLWGGARVLLVRPRRRSSREARSPVGEHPNAMALSTDGQAPLRRVRQHQRRLGGRPRRADGARSRSRWRSLPARRRAARPTRSASRRTATRCSSPTPTTTRSRSSTCRGRRPAGSRASSRPAGIRPASQFSRDGRRIFDPARQGPDVDAEPARTAAGRGGRPLAIRRRDADRARSRSSRLPAPPSSRRTRRRSTA